MDKEIRKVDDVRDDITKIDYEIAELFEKRMGFAAELALSKKQAGESIYNKNKEDRKVIRYYKEPIQSICHKGIRGSFYSDDVHKPQISVSYGSPERPLY